MWKTNKVMLTKYSKILQQTKAGPRSSGTPFLVFTIIIHVWLCLILYVVILCIC